MTFYSKIAFETIENIGSAHYYRARKSSFNICNFQMTSFYGWFDFFFSLCFYPVMGKVERHDTHHSVMCGFENYEKLSRSHKIKYYTQNQLQSSLLNGQFTRIHCTLHTAHIQSFFFSYNFKCLNASIPQEVFSFFWSNQHILVDSNRKCDGHHFKSTFWNCELFFFSAHISQHLLFIWSWWILFKWL